MLIEPRIAALTQQLATLAVGEVQVLDSDAIASRVAADEEAWLAYMPEDERGRVSALLEQEQEMRAALAAQGRLPESTDWEVQVPVPTEAVSNALGVASRFLAASQEQVDQRNAELRADASNTWLTLAGFRGTISLTGSARFDGDPVITIRVTYHDPLRFVPDARGRVRLGRVLSDWWRSGPSTP